ncbi:hypothetical protein HZB74_00630 [Candidatus Saccharibacteria bacterium]|nr:hypothetical protein [Candidatus Saccharibacteria bacterium]
MFEHFRKKPENLSDAELVKRIDRCIELHTFAMAARERARSGHYRSDRAKLDYDQATSARANVAAVLKKQGLWVPKKRDLYPPIEVFTAIRWQLDPTGENNIQSGSEDGVVVSLRDHIRVNGGKDDGPDQHTQQS